jgi:hypothetical protein
MSRSRRRTPICGITTADSEKRDKQIANRRLRRAVSRVLRSDAEADVLPHRRELSNPWLMDKDGKQRFDPEKHAKELRK